MMNKRNPRAPQIIRDHSHFCSVTSSLRSAGNLSLLPSPASAIADPNPSAFSDPIPPLFPQIFAGDLKLGGIKNPEVIRGWVPCNGATNPVLRCPFCASRHATFRRAAAQQPAAPKKSRASRFPFRVF